MKRYIYAQKVLVAGMCTPKYTTILKVISQAFQIYLQVFLH